MIYIGIFWVVYVIGYFIMKRLTLKEENKNKPSNSVSTVHDTMTNYSAPKIDNDFSLIITRSRMLADRAAARAETIRFHSGGCLEDDAYRNLMIPKIQKKFQEETSDKNCLVMGFGSLHADIDDSPGKTDNFRCNISGDNAPFELIIDGKKVDFEPKGFEIYAFLLDDGVHSISFKVRGRYVNPFKTEKTVTMELYGNPKFMAVDLCIYTENSYKNGKLRQGTDARFLVEKKESLEALLDEYCDAFDLNIIDL